MLPLPLLVRPEQRNTAAFTEGNTGGGRVAGVARRWAGVAARSRDGARTSGRETGEPSHR